MDSDRVVFLVVGVVIVVVVGRLLAFSGRRFLASSAPSERNSAGSAATLAAGLFHLLTLGIVALLAVAPVGSSGQVGLLVRVGILLIVLAIIYGITLALLNRRRQEALAVEIETHRHTPNDVSAGVRVEPVEPTDPARSWNRPMNQDAGTATGQPRTEHSL
jgi:hypothetical protein